MKKIGNLLWMLRLFIFTFTDLWLGLCFGKRQRGMQKRILRKM